MKLNLKESFIYKILFICIINPYKNSFFKKFFHKISINFKESAIYKGFNKYLFKTPFFDKSFSYKIFRRLVKCFEIVADFLHKSFLRLFSGSFVANEVKSFKNISIELKILLVSILIGALNLGYSLVSIIIFKINILISLALLLLSLILFLISKNLNIIKNSFIYKFLKSLV